MASIDNIPGMRSGAIKQNILVSIVYLFLLPFLIILAPFYLMLAVATNRRGWGKAITNSPLGRIPTVRKGGWQAGLTIFIISILVIGGFGAVLSGAEDPTGEDGEVVNAIDDTTTDEINAASSADDQEGTAEETPGEDDQGDRPPPPDNANETVTPDGTLDIHHLDVGQADAALIITPDGETILIDTGDWRQDGQEIITYLDSQGIDRIDHLIATHPHADHIGGHAAVIEWAETEGDGIGAAYDSGVPHTTQTYARYLDAIEDHDVELFTVEEGDTLPLESENLSAAVINPPANGSGDGFHYNSVSIVFEFGEFRYITTGDSEGDAEERMITDWEPELPANVYQAGHHGSSTSSTEVFLDAVDPEYAIISSGFDSQYGHPHDEVLEWFDAMGIETYWTGVHGHIVLTTDGDTIDFATEAEFSTDPMELLEAKSADENDDDTDDNDGEGYSDSNKENNVADAITVDELNVDGVSADEEYIVLKNTGDGAFDLSSWQIRDRENDGRVARGFSPFTFPADFELDPGDRVTIWTGDGDNTDSDLYWGYGVNIWRADGDIIILMNPEGEHVFEYAYGDQV